MNRSVAPAPGPHLAASRPRRPLQGADDGGPHRHDPPSGLPGPADRPGGLLADLVALALHPVLLDPLGVDRLEGADADVERHPGDLDPRGLDLPQEPFREVEPRRGGRHRSGPAGVDGLVALAVLGGVRPVDVGGKGDVPQPVQVRLDGLGEPQPVAMGGAVLPLVDHLGGETLGDLDPRAGPRPPSRLDQGLPLALAHRLDEQDLHLPAPGAPAVQARRDHPRVVEHQQVSGVKEARQVAHAGVPLGAGPVERQEPALAARRGLLRDARGGSS